MKELRDQLRASRVATEIVLDPSISEPYMLMRDRFAALSTSKKVWDTLSSRKVDQKKERSAASHQVERTEVYFKPGESELVHTEWTVPFLKNANGGDLFLYPAFVLYWVSKDAFAVIDSRDVDVKTEHSRFIERERIPEDTRTVGQTWAKVNKDGSPDKRFVGNHQIPIVEYGTLRLTSPTGLNEEFLISDPNRVDAFGQAWNAFRRELPADAPDAPA